MTCNMPIYIDQEVIHGAAVGGTYPRLPPLQQQTNPKYQNEVLDIKDGALS